MFSQQRLKVKNVKEKAEGSKITTLRNMISSYFRNNAPQTRTRLVSVGTDPTVVTLTVP